MSPRRARLLSILCGLHAVCCVVAADPPSLPGDSTPTLTLPEAVSYGLQHNPQLAVVRQQHGIAAAGVVLARTYPFNPVTQSTIAGASGTGVTYSVPNAHKITIDLWVYGQFGHRKRAAEANLSKTDWDIAGQELTQAVAIVRAFDSVMYRESKLQVIEEFVRLNEKAVDQIKQLVENGTLKPADLIVARAEVNDVRSQLGAGRTALTLARRDFIRSLGVLDLTLVPRGTLDRPVATTAPEQMVTVALEQRPDLQSRRAAIAQAEAQLRFERSDRFGNPTVGPVYEFNESKVTFAGVQVGAPIPIFNRKQGEIRQREAERCKALLELKQTEVEIQQDVPMTLTRLNEAREWVTIYQTKVLPELTKNLADIEQLFQQGASSVDVLRVLDVRRKLLRAQDGYLDALLTYTTVLAELAQAVGDPTLAIGAGPPAKP